MRWRLWAAWLALSCGAAWSAEVEPAPASRPAAAAAVLLSESSFWRKQYTFFPPQVSLQAAGAAGMDTGAAARAKAIERHFWPGLQTPPPPPGWTGTDFDDRDWLLRRGRDLTNNPRRRPKYVSDTSVFHRGTDGFVKEIGLICQRGRFHVADRSKVRKLTLSLTHRGGFVACLNGTEIARGAMPAGQIAPDTPAADYPLESFFSLESIASKKYAGFDYHLSVDSPQWSASVPHGVLSHAPEPSARNVRAHAETQCRAMCARPHARLAATRRGARPLHTACFRMRPDSPPGMSRRMRRHMVRKRRAPRRVAAKRARRHRTLCLRLRLDVPPGTCG